MLMDWLKDGYIIYAEFEDIGPVREQTPVKISGVQVGQVESIELTDRNFAKLKLRVNKSLKIYQDSIFAIKFDLETDPKPIIKIFQGGDEPFLKEGETVVDTESIIDLSDLISKCNPRVLKETLYNK